MIATGALRGALEVVGADAYAAGWHQHTGPAAAARAAEQRTLADRAWRRELDYFLATGEVIDVDGNLDRIHHAVDRWTTALYDYGRAAGRADAPEAAERAAKADLLWSITDSELRDYLTDGRPAPTWPRPDPELLRGPNAPFGVYAAEQAALDQRLTDRVEQLIIVSATTRGWEALTLTADLIERLLVDSRPGIEGECGPAGDSTRPSRAWWLRRTAEVARSWRIRLWGPGCHVPSPVDDPDWLRPPAITWSW